MLVFTEPSAQKLPASVLCAERLGQRGDLDRIAERRAGAVRLDVADRGGVDAGDRPAPWRSPRPARRRSARCSRPCCAPSLLIAEPRITAWIVSPSASASSSRLSTTTPTPSPPTVPLRLRVEGAAVAVGRQDHALLVEVAACAAET